MVRDTCVGPNGTESPGGKASGSKANIPPPCRRRRRRAGVWRTEPFGPPKRRRSIVDMEERHRYGRLGSSGERNAKKHVSEISTKETERFKNGKGLKGPGGEHIEDYGQQVTSVRTAEGFVHKSTWQVADVGRPRVSASHSIPLEATCSSGRVRHTS